MKAVGALMLVGGGVAVGVFLLLPRPPASKAPTAAVEALAPGAMVPIQPAIEFLLSPGTAKLRQREFKLNGSYAYAVELLERKLPRPKWTYFSTSARHYPKVKWHVEDEAPDMWSESLTTLITREKQPGEKTAPMIKVSSLGGRRGASHAKATLTVYPSILER